ncbi:AB hydrolase-1 domain-containing protein [Tumidithrix helvetica PCC 7403]
MEPMANRLKSEGFDVVNLNYPSRTRSINDLALEVFSRIIADPTCDRASRIHFVTHSMGGILVRSFLKNYSLPKLGSVVMLSPPNQGSEVVDKLGSLRLFDLLNGPAGRELSTDPHSTPNILGSVNFKLGVIAGDLSINWINSILIKGSNDGKVSVERTKIEGMSDHITIHAAHPFLMTNQEAILQTIHFLKKGAFHNLPKRKFGLFLSKH